MINQFLYHIHLLSMYSISVLTLVSHLLVISDITSTCDMLYCFIWPLFMRNNWQNDMLYCK